MEVKISVPKCHTLHLGRYSKGIFTIRDVATSYTKFLSCQISNTSPLLLTAT